MTVDEIISNAEFCANEYKKYSEIAHEPERSGFKQYEGEHRQLAEWLKELKQLREQKCEVLDKIRAEIEQAADRQFQIAMSVSDLNERYAHTRMENAYRHSLSVIDKCKAEREECRNDYERRIIMKESNKLTKGELFSASVRCPKCGMAMHMRVSDIPEYAYQCIECDEDFYSRECPETVSDCSDGNGNYISLWEITLRNKDTKWYTANKNILNQICDKYDVYFMGCDDCDKEAVLIDFGWKEPPNAEVIQSFTDEVIKLL